ncbi:MAG: hypothetical protein H5T92_05215 [Synergistales bacterium]|nr:hypothetical protein [Synergistales bacterium]
MKKGPVIWIVVSMVVGLFAVTAISSTTSDGEWSWWGGGSFSTKFVSGDDAIVEFHTEGFSGNGEFHAEDADDNPWGYGVDTTSTWVTAVVSGGGFLEYKIQRTDGAAKWSPPGQVSYSRIETSDYGRMNFQARSIAAELQLAGNYNRFDNFEAAGDWYRILHQVTDDAGDGASVLAWSELDGVVSSAAIRFGGGKAGGTGAPYGFNFGRLPVCGDSANPWYDHYASYNATGPGWFEVHAWADNALTVFSGITPPEVPIPPSGGTFMIPGDGTDNSAQYHLAIRHGGSFYYPDYGVAGY